MLYGVIDIGSNTVRMNVYSINDSNKFNLLFSEKETLGLVSYISNNKLSDKGVKKIVNLLKDFKKDLHILKIDDYTFFSTAVLRNIKNSDDVLKEIKEKTGIEIFLLSSELEAELSYLGAKTDCNYKNGILIDVGGGSSEIVIFKKGNILGEYSLPIGSLIMFNEYVSNMLPSNEEKKLIKNRVFSEIDKLDIFNNKKLIKENISKKTAIPIMCGVGGSIRAVRNILLDLNLISKDELISLDSLAILKKELSTNDRSSYDKILQVKPSRVHTLVPGLIIVESIAKYFGCKEIKVSKCGVREGFLYKYVLD